MRSTAFVPSGDIAPAKRGFSIAESEIGLSASVDDKIYGNLIFSLAPDNSVEVEEAYGVLTAVPGGFTPKFGRFLSGIGYLNDQHQHVWDFYDAPLPYQAFLGGQFRSDGLQLKWIAPTDTFVEVGAEIGDGANFPGGERNSATDRRRGVLRPRRRRHRSEQQLARGVSWLGLRPRDRMYAQTDLAGNAAQIGFDGKSQGRDRRLRLKYVPNGNARGNELQAARRVFLAARDRAIPLRQRRRLRALRRPRATGRGRAGWYVEGVQSVHARVAVWRALRLVDPGNVSYGTNAAYLAPTSFDPQRYSLMLDYTPSEFSRFRVQWQQSKLRPEVTDNQLFIQYILTLGAHGAHKY
jgi:hypothetical protein